MSQLRTSVSRSASHANPARCCSLTTQPVPVPTSSTGHDEPTRSTSRPAEKRSGATISTEVPFARPLARDPDHEDGSVTRRSTSTTPFDPTKCSSTVIIPSQSNGVPVAGQVFTASRLAIPTYLAEEGNVAEPVRSGPTEYVAAPERLRRARSTVPLFARGKLELEPSPERGAGLCVIRQRNPTRKTQEGRLCGPALCYELSAVGCCR